jgi:hypothetical protein
MNVIDCADHSKKKQNTDYFVHLVHIALADDIITRTERELLNRIGLRLGFSDLEIDTIIGSASKSDYIPPYELFDRFEQVYEIVKMTLADGVIDKNEIRLAGSFAAKSSFRENEIPGLLVLLISGIREGKNEEELFELYKKTRKG